MKIGEWQVEEKNANIDVEPCFAVKCPYHPESDMVLTGGNIGQAVLNVLYRCPACGLTISFAVDVGPDLAAKIRDALTPRLVQVTPSVPRKH